MTQHQLAHSVLNGCGSRHEQLPPADNAAVRSGKPTLPQLEGNRQQFGVEGGRSSGVPQAMQIADREKLCLRILALGGAFGPVLFTAVVGVCSALRPGYNHLTQFMSELGATGTSHAALMNLAGFLPAGSLIAALGTASAWLIPRSGRSILAGALISIFGFGIALAGIFHCDPGCPQHGASLASTIHDRISVAAFLACIAGIGLWASHFQGIAEFRTLWKYSAASSLAGLFFLCMLASSIETRELTGLWQRLMLGTLFVWCVVLGRRLFHHGNGTTTKGQSPVDRR